MDGRKWSIVLFLVLTHILAGAWRSSREDRRDIRELSGRRDLRRGTHYHSKRHMLPENEPNEKRITTQKSRDVRKMPKKSSGHLTPLEEHDMDNDEVVSVAIGPPPMRPKYDKVHWKHPTKTAVTNNAINNTATNLVKDSSGHLTPLEEDDMDNDEVVTVAIGPPPMRPKYDKVHWKHPTKTAVTNNAINNTATNLVKDVLAELGREILARPISEDFIFGQYVGNTMKNLTADLKLKMQHEILELIVKYQKINRGETSKAPEAKPTSLNPLVPPMTPKEIKPDKKFIPGNETEDTWSDFSNLAKIVG